MLTSDERATLPSQVDGAVGAAQQQVPAMAGRQPVTDCTQPPVVGFILKHLLMTDDEVDEAKCRLERFAKVEGFAMGTIYVEEPETTPAALEALIAAVSRYEATTVLIPSRLHFAALAVTHHVKDAFERATGARVIIADFSP